MEIFSLEYILHFLFKNADISIVQRDENEGFVRIYAEQGVADSLLQHLKKNTIQNGTRVQLDGKNFDVWSERKGALELYILKKVDDKVELENKIVDYSYMKDIDVVYREMLHEIRTPLGTMRNYLHIVTEEMIRHGGGRRKNDVALDNLQAINEEIMRIDSMLDAFRGTWNEAEVDLLSSDLAYEAGFMEKIYRKVFEGKGVTFSVEGPKNGVHISVPTRSVRQVLSNLIQNAFEAVEEGGQVWVRTRELEGRSVLEVGDNGCGIDERLVPFLFREPLDSDKGEGRGYGLWITGKLVRKYEGSIEYERSVDGSVVRVEFRKSDGAK